MRTACLIVTNVLVLGACGNDALQDEDAFGAIESAVTTRTRTISEMREVAAGFEVIDECSNTFVQVLARIRRERTTGSDATREREVTVNFGSRNNCLPPDDLNHIITGDGTTTEPTLVRIPDTLLHFARRLRQRDDHHDANALNGILYVPPNRAESR